MSENDRAVAVVDRATDLIPLIDIDREIERSENFREFIHRCLDESKGHYGSIGREKKKFLHQPGAEVILQALQAAPDYEIVREEMDRDADYALFVVKCTLKHRMSGLVLGSASGAASTDEKAQWCKYVPERALANNPFVTCPVHGEGPGRTFYRRREDGGGLGVACNKKIPMPLAQTIQPTLSIAEKRAMVKAVRTVGCVSEFFSQDDDLLRTGDEAEWDQHPSGKGGPVRQAPAAPQRKATAPKAAAPKAEPKSQPQSVPVPAAETPPAMTKEQSGLIKDAFLVIKDAGVTPDELGAYLGDEGFPVEAGLFARAMFSLCWSKDIAPAEVANAVVQRFKPTEEQVLTEEPDVVEGEVVDEPSFE